MGKRPDYSRKLGVDRAPPAFFYLRLVTSYPETEINRRSTQVRRNEAATTRVLWQQYRGDRTAKFIDVRGKKKVLWADTESPGKRMSLGHSILEELSLPSGSGAIPDCRNH
jgi:hypothetical protein